MKELIESIQTRLANNGDIKYVDENWGQLDYYSPHPPVKWPCALIDIVDVNFSNIGRDTSQVPVNRQQGLVTVEIRIANLKISNTSAKAPNLQKDYGLSTWDLLEEVHQELHGWNPIPSGSKLIRGTVNRVRRDDGIQEYAIRYTLELNDC